MKSPVRIEIDTLKIHPIQIKEFESEHGVSIRAITNGWLIGIWANYKPSKEDLHVLEPDGCFFVKKPIKSFKPLKFAKSTTIIEHFPFERFIQFVYWVATQKQSPSAKRIEAKVTEILFDSEISKMKGDARKIMLMKWILRKKFDLEEIVCRKMVALGYEWLKAHPKFPIECIQKANDSYDDPEWQFFRALTNKHYFYPGTMMIKTALNCLHHIRIFGLKAFLELGPLEDKK